MLKHYIIMALRQFLRHRSTTLINTGCLILGLICFIPAYGVYSYYRYSDRQLPNSERVYFISQTFRLGSTSSPMRVSLGAYKVAPLLQAEFPEFQTVARMSLPIPVIAEVADRQQSLDVRGIDEAFLQVVSLPFAARGTDHSISRPGTAILSEAAARRVFGAGNPIGRTMVLQGNLAIEIVGVVASPLQPSHLNDKSFDMLVSMSTYRTLFAGHNGDGQAAELFETGDAFQFSTYILLRPEAARRIDAINERLADFYERHPMVERALIDKKMHAEPIAKLAESRISMDPDALAVDAVLLMLASAVLGIACLNYAMIAVAQARARMREIGLRRAVGASVLQVVGQQLVETLLLAVGSYLAAFACVLLLLPALRAVAGIDLSTVLMHGMSFWFGNLGALFIVICTAGAYPAMVLAGYRPAQSLRGSATAAGSSRFSMVLAGTQFGVVGFLLIAVLVMHAQNAELRRAALRPDADPVVVLNNDLRAVGVDPEVLRVELERQPFVKSVSFTQFKPWSGTFAVGCCISGPAPASRNFPILSTFVGYDYFRTLDVPLLAGRDFDRSRGDDLPQPGRPNNVIIDRVSAAVFGWSDAQRAIGQVLLALNNGGPPRQFRIIGVAASRNTQSTGPGSAIKLYTLAPQALSVAHVRISKADVAAGLASIDAAWRNLGVRIALDRRFMDDLFEDSFQRFSRNAAVIAVGCAIAIGIALVGLIAMALQIVGERRREIGIRKTLGASVSRVLKMLLRDSSRPVVIGNLIAWPLAFIAMRVYLSVFTSRVGLTPLPFVLSLVITVLIAWLCVGGQAWRAARLKPASVLRYE